MRLRVSEGGFRLYNYMLRDPISSTSPSMMTLAVQRGNTDTDPHFLPLQHRNERWDTVVKTLGDFQLLR